MQINMLHVCNKYALYIQTVCQDIHAICMDMLDIQKYFT